MYWKNTKDMFHCLPLMKLDGKTQLQFMYDSASIYEATVSRNTLAATHSFFKSSGMVSQVVRDGKTLSSSEVADYIQTLEPYRNAMNCEHLLQMYVPENKFSDICQCCPLSANYKNARHSQELKFVNYVLSNGGPAFIDINVSEVNLCSLELIPYGKKPNMFFPLALLPKLVDFSISNAFVCSSVDAFWQSFCAQVLTVKRGTKSVLTSYGKMDETALNYIKNMIYLLFKPVNVNIDEMLELLKEPYSYSPPAPISKTDIVYLKDVIDTDVALDEIFPNNDVQYECNVGKPVDGTNNITELVVEEACSEIVVEVSDKSNEKGSEVVLEEMTNESSEPTLEAVSKDVIVEHDVIENIECESLPDEPDIAMVEHNDEHIEILVSQNGKAADIKPEEVVLDNNKVAESLMGQVYTINSNDGVLFNTLFEVAVKFSRGKALMIEPDDDLICVPDNSYSSEFIKFSRDMAGEHSVIGVDVVCINEVIGLLICTPNRYFVKYDSCCFGVLHALFKSNKVTKICQDVYTLAKYVFSYDECFLNVIGSYQLSQLNVPAATLDNYSEWKLSNEDRRNYEMLFAYDVLHALSSDVSAYVQGKQYIENEKVCYDFYGAMNVDYGMVLEVTDIKGVSDAREVFHKSVYMLYNSWHIYKYNIKIVAEDNEKLLLFVPYNVYEFVDILVMAVSASVKTIINVTPSFSIIPYCK